MTTERAIKALKKRHSKTLLAHPNVAGVGVERDATGDYVLVVHLTADAADLPAEIDGHRLHYVRSGPFRKQ